MHCNGVWSHNVPVESMLPSGRTRANASLVPYIATAFGIALLVTIIACIVWLKARHRKQSPLPTRAIGKIHKRAKRLQKPPARKPDKSSYQALPNVLPPSATLPRSGRKKGAAISNADGKPRGSRKESAASCSAVDDSAEMKR